MKEKQKRLGLRSLYYFTKYILGYDLLQPQPHWEMTGFLQGWPNSDKLLLAPRGTFKSTVTTISMPLWLLCHNPNLRILVVTAELENAKKFLNQIKQQVETNTLFRELYGAWDSRKNELTWSSSAVTFSCRDDWKMSADSITCISYKVSKVSQHYDMVILDDIQVEKNVSSVEAIDQVEEYMKLLIPLIDPNPDTGKRGPIIQVGTRWHLDDVYGRKLAHLEKVRRDRRARGERPKEFPLRVMVRGAWDESGKLYFPGRLTKSFIKSLVDEGYMTRYQASCQYMNNPLPEEDQIFRVSDFRFWNEKGRQSGDLKEILPMPPGHNFITLDPSLGEYADSDYSAFCVGRVDMDWNIYWEEVVREHLNPEEIVERMFALAKKWKPMKTGIESVIFQKALIYFFQRYARERGEWFYVTELKPEHKVKKDLRIRGFSPFVASGQVYFKVHDDLNLTEPQDVLFHSIVPGQDMLAREMVHFPLAKTKDCVDAASYFPQIMFPAGRPPDVKPAPAGSLDWIVKKLRRDRRASEGRIGQMLR